jgi:hypothetical protein
MQAQCDIEDVATDRIDILHKLCVLCASAPLREI